MLPGLHQSELHQPSSELHQLPGHSEMRHNRLGDVKDPITARKVQKADREKLRRDRLNEQFQELGTALDPDRPKNDKATILGDTVQILKDLTTEVKRLKSEHTSLMEESRDLAQEKNELREEKTVLKAEIDQLRSQFDQRVRTMFSWTAMDPTMMMSAPPFPYSMPIPHPGSTAAPDSRSTPLQGHAQTPLIPSPFVHVPVASGAIPMHPPFQAYPFFPPYSSPMNTHTHVERPSAQYPSPIQPLPGYLVHLQLSQGNRPASAQLQTANGASQSVDAGTSTQASNGSSENHQREKSITNNKSHNHVAYNGHRPSPSHSGSKSDHLDASHIDLQLKTPGSASSGHHPQSYLATHSSKEQEQIQEALSKVNKGMSSPCDRSPIVLGLQLGEKTCSGTSLPCKCNADASSSSHGNEHSSRSDDSQSPTRES